MRPYRIVFMAVLSVAVLGVATASEISVTAECWPAAGWMKDGWGNVAYTFVNKGETPAKIVAWTAHWEVDGKPFKVNEDDEDWSDTGTVDLPPGQETKIHKLGWLPPKAVDAAKPGDPVWTGTFTIAVGDETTEVSWRCPVPAAELPEPLVTTKSDYIGYAIMESRYKDFASKDRLLTWLNDSYKAMWDLTGRQPYNGDFILIKESPAHPWYAYAGNPIVMSTASMKGFTEEIDAGVMPFGWIHELGHDFDDGMGEWYMWDGATCEWQANWKLNYAYETIPAQDFIAKWGDNHRAGYNPPGGQATLSGKQFMDSFFLFFGDPYLADATRTWDTMASDDYHAFHLRFVRVYGWDVYKKWYRTFVRFEELGLETPETAEEKVNLTAAVLSHHVGVDLVPMFQRWRMPVTAEQVARMHKRYPIANAAEVEKPESAEAAARLITLKVERVQEDGWMKAGWGHIKYTFKNEGDLPCRITAWTAQWFVEGEPFVPEDADEDDDGIARDKDTVLVPAGEETSVTKFGWLNPELADKAAPGAAVWKGTFAVKMADLEFAMPWEAEVPEAVITEKLVRVEGKHMAYEVTEKHHEMLGDNSERLLRWLDQAYEAMVDLTGYVPYDGKIITIIESPPHPWYAYAGNPIIMDTTYMDALVEMVNRGEMPFGWIHELGHDFDIADNLYDDWYAISIEAEANLKLVYVFGNIPDQDWKSEWGVDEGASYPAPAEGILLDGGDCMARKFLFAGDEELADATLSWTETFCQHIFMQRVAHVYGWDPIKKWYRTYKILADQGLPKPETHVERVQLMAAILTETVGADMVPVFQRWKAPVTQDDVDAMKAKYPIEDAVKSIVLPSAEEGTTE